MHHPRSTHFPYTTLFRSFAQRLEAEFHCHALPVDRERGAGQRRGAKRQAIDAPPAVGEPLPVALEHLEVGKQVVPDRKSTRLNSSHVSISYAVFCLKKKN